MSVRFGTSFCGKLPFQIRDTFCQSTCLSRLYSKVAKVPKCSMRVRNISDHLRPGYELWRAGLLFAFILLNGLVFVCVHVALFEFVNVCHSFREDDRASTV